MVMLALLLRYFRTGNLGLSAVHMNHNLRGTEADRDQDLVKEYCRLNDLPLSVHQLDVKSYAAEHSVSIEMAGRALRYRHFQEDAERFDDSVVATAHTLDDHIETILLNMYKGTGLRGLKGIPVSRENIVRPIRNLTKDELYAYAEAEHIPFREDHTNFENLVQRNIIRNEVLPLLKKSINPRIVESIETVSLNAAEVSDYIETVVVKVYPTVVIKESDKGILIDLFQLQSHPVTIQKEILRMCFARIGKEFQTLTYEQLTALIANIHQNRTGANFRILKDVELAVDRGRVMIGRCRERIWEDFTVEPGRFYRTDYFTFHTEVLEKSGYCRDRTNKNVEYIDLETVVGTLNLRKWRRGDRIRPLGSRFSKKLSDVYIDQKIPRYRKNLIPILEYNGEIIWLCGIQLSEYFKIKENTKNILKLVYEEI